MTGLSHCEAKTVVRCHIVSAYELIVRSYVLLDGPGYELANALVGATTYLDDAMSALAKLGKTRKQTRKATSKTKKKASKKS